jgi:hypothetical protein
MRVGVQVCIKGAECDVLGAVVKQRNLAAMRKHCPPKKKTTSRYSLLAIRCHFWFGVNLASYFAH